MVAPVTPEPVNPPQQAEGDVIDRRVRALLSEYVRLTGATLEPAGEGLLRLRVPASEAAAFRGRFEHFLALDLDTLERHPEAELPVIGSAFWKGLVEAIRRRGQRCVAGALPLTVTGEPEAPDVAVVDATVELAGRRRETRRIVRVTAKITVAAATTVHEQVIQGDALDVTTGRPLPAPVLALLDAPDGALPFEEPPAAATMPAERLAPALVQGMEERVAAQVDALRAQAERDLAAELRRIDRYYEAVKEEVRQASGPGSAALGTVEHEHQKRRTEEERRHEVRVSVEPLQVLERSVVVERVTWRLATAAGRSAELHAERYLAGDGGWGIHCADCGRQPEQLAVCRRGHAIGAECTLACSVCAERFCLEHGYPGCAIDGAPVCAEHAVECWSCERTTCTTHQGRCAEGHDACTECLVACGLCARTICRRHATTSHAESPRGARVLCPACVVFCEGATSEPIGRDEAAPCGTCGRFVCERHQSRCVVDGRVHCSRHIRRTDRSRHFVCDGHVAACDHEQPDVVFAASQVHACVECGRIGCDLHAAQCHGDQRWHCRTHLEVLHDQVDALGCAEHRSTCHVDGRTFSLAGTAPCEVCTRATCRTHLGRCAWCGARVCTHELRDGRCTTCSSLQPAEDLPDDVIAALARLPGELRPKQRLVARDGSRFVVQLELGWTRKVVVTVPHGAAAPGRVVRHSLFGSKGL